MDNSTELLRGLTDPNRKQQMIQEIVDRYGTLERFRDAGGITQPLLDEIGRVAQELQHKAMVALAEGFSNCWNQLIDFGNWQELASDPKRFDEELNRWYSEIKKLMKRVHGVPSHRPTKNAKRDQDIYELHVTTGLSLGKIAIRKKLPKPLVETAYKRQYERKREQLRVFVEFICDCYVMQHQSQPQTNRPT